VINLFKEKLKSILVPNIHDHRAGWVVRFEVFMASSRMLRRVALVRNDVSEKLNAPIIRVTRIGELGT
jgi:hypothetical protein